MRAERWQQIQSLFDAAVELPTDQRNTWLAFQCGADVALRSEVEHLLQAFTAERSGGFIDAAIRSVASDVTMGNVRPGMRLDEYRLVQELGSGGMGTVFLAERADGEYTGLAAIKLVRGGFASPDIERRFRTERQMLADLEHPNIARLLDGGTAPDGMPYLVMEYVDGQPITAWAHAQRLDLDDRLRLFLTICDAVQHAHRSLIVHRDLKPSNILVRQDGVPKLLDFGIAKLLPSMSSAAQQTFSMVRVMTPSYASPEQIDGRPVTLATDVYSLGVVLYQLLTGVHPFTADRPGPLEVRRRIVEDEPLPPSRAMAPAEGPRPASARSLRGDLDAIVMRAMQKRVEQRYATVEQLGADILRHMHGLPVLARPQTPGYRLDRFVRRNRAAVAGSIAAIVIVATLVGIDRMRLMRERDEAQADVVAARQLSSFLVSVFGAGDVPAGPADSTASTAAQNAAVLLDPAAERARTEFITRPRERARALTALAEANLRVGRHPAAVTLLAEALDAIAADPSAVPADLLDDVDRLVVPLRGAGAGEAATALGRRADGLRARVRR